MSALFAKEKDKSDNPFCDVPEPRAFYHPTLPKKLSKKSKGISLSPERKKSHLRPNEDGYHIKRKELSPGEKGFLSGSNTMLAKELPTHDTPSPGPADTSSKFDESWPASERPSTIESPSYAQNVSSTSAATSHISGSGSSPASHGSTSTSMCKDPVTSARGQKSNQEAESTLGRLIDRFRFGAPQSREERARQQATSTKDFWWLSSSSSSPVLPSQQHSSSSISGHSPKENTPLHGISSADCLRGKEGTRRGTGGGGGRGKGRGASRIPSWSGVSKSGVSSLSSSRRLSSGSTLASSSSSSLKMPSITDRETEEIQRRAEKLLEISEETVLSEPVVSSDGLGSFSTSSPITNDSMPPRGDEAYISRLHDKENHPRPTLFPASLSYAQQSQDPQEDILQQWRMRRRMEQAKEGTLHRISGRMVHSPLRQNQTENVGTRRDGRVTNEDADSKLADFRRRLQQQRLLTEARVASNIQQVPVKDTTTTHIGTDPIPQSIATQTGRGMPSCVQNGSRSLSADQTTNMQQDRTLRSDTMQHGDEGMPCQSARPIASPNIQGVRNQRTHAADVIPHLHMSCDILPCCEIGPHVHTVRDVGDKEEFAGQGKMHHHQTGVDFSCENNDDHLLRESIRNNVVGTFPQRQTMLRVSSEDQRATSENQRGASVAKPYQHQEKIQRHEHELRSDEAELHSHRYEEHNVGSDIEGEDEAFQHEVAKNDSIRISSNGFQRTEVIRSGVEKEQMRDIEHYKAAEDTRTVQRPQTSAISTRTLEDTAEGLNAASSTRKRDVNPAAMQQTRTDDADQVEGAKRQLDFVSSSPVNNAIGRVISNRIFSSPVGQRLIPSSQRSTPSSIRSSSLSQDTLMFTPPASDRVTSRLRMSRDMLDSADTGSPESESGASSDSEEFKDDEMLQVLRKQREECIHQLNRLDHLLSNSSKD